MTRLALTVSSFCLCVSLAHADPRAAPTNPEAAAYFQRGGTLFGLKQFEEAITAYKRGALIESAPVFDLAIGQCYRMLAKYDDALWYFRRFLKYGHPTGTVLRGVTDLIAQTLDEQSRHPPPPPPPTPPPPPPPAPPPAPAPAPAPITITAPWYHDTIGLTLGGAGLLSLGIGSYFLVDGVQKHNASNTDPSDLGRFQLADQARSRYKLSAIAGGIGAALVTASIIKLTVYRVTIQVSNDSTLAMMTSRF